MTTTRLPQIPAIGLRETRNWATKLEVRDDGAFQWRLVGIASRTAVPYEMGNYDEVVAPGAFAATLARRPDVQLLVNHEGLPLARTTIPPGQPGHLALSEDSEGLHVDAQLDRSDPDAQTLVRKIRSGLLGGTGSMSFAFRVVKQDWNADRTLRTLQEVDLARGDVSVCNFGASPTTLVDVRSRNRGRRGPGNLSLYQYRLRAIQMRDIHLRNEAGRRR